MSKKILWIEDDSDIIFGLMRPLTERGYKIHTIYSQREYFETKDKILSSFDLIVLDILLPEGHGKAPEEKYTGLGILQHLREQRKLDIPVVVLTAVSNPDVINKLRELGVKTIMKKPTLPSELEEEVIRILER
jgi:DNA-binding response OmpR family regulator